MLNQVQDDLQSPVRKGLGDGVVILQGRDVARNVSTKWAVGRMSKRHERCMNAA
ncbi:MAG: hypothetical protein LBE56_01645 [Tannerella sp.]|nr:hypothetical protein [Tannerella sp.]